MNPVVIYVDDEPNNLVVFEASLPMEWEIHVFSSPLEAVEKIQDINPWVVVSDQRMPGMTGVKFLELANKLHPNSVKMITTGYSDESLVIDSIRRAQVFDYIMKPWEVEDLEIRVDKAAKHYLSKRERDSLTEELQEKAKQLGEKNQALENAMAQANLAKEKEKSLRKELEYWIPPVVSWATKEKVEFPMHRNLCLMAIDIVGSGSLHNLSIGEHTARQKILLEFSMLVVKHGGYVEAFEGDAAYANFGLMDTGRNPCDAAFAVANEFRAALVGLQNHYETEINCGIGLHFAENVKAMVHEYSVTSSSGVIIQKRFSTESPGIDLVHRMEKLTHKLPGSNIVMTKDFMKNLSSQFPEADLREIGEHLFKGQSEAYALTLLKSRKVEDEDVVKVMAPSLKAS